MNELGGTNNQSGVLYQNTISALYIARLCDSTQRLPIYQPTLVRVEALEHVDDTVITFEDGHTVFLQAKEIIDSKASAWAGLWADFAHQYLDTNFQQQRDHLKLFTGYMNDDVEDVHSLAERARNNNSPKDWQKRLNEKQKKLLGKIKPLLDARIQGDAELMDFFAHIRVEIASREQMERDWLPLWVPTSNQATWTVFRNLRDRVGGGGSRAR